MEFGKVLEAKYDNYPNNQTCRGLNGNPEYKSTGDLFVSFFFSLVRDLERDKVFRYVSEICVNSTPEELVDLVVLAFQTRATRNVGKGERKLFYDMLMGIQTFVGEEVVIKVLPLIPEYGYYKDYFFIMNDENCSKNVYNECTNIICKQILEDFTNLTLRCKPVTLLGKYMPREKSSQYRLANMFADTLFYGTKSQRLRKYRKMLSILNKEGLQTTTEVFMCAKKFSDIDFSKVGSLCLNRNKKAFLNEMCKGSLQRSYESDRIEARENLLNTKTLKSSQLFPHELVRSLLKNGTPSPEESKVLDVQWKEMCKNIFKKIEDVSDTLVMVDASGSMTVNDFLPLSVSASLGIMFSENCKSCYKDKVMTFSSRPTFVSFRDCDTFCSKVQKLLKAQWGMNTNLEAAFDSIIDVGISGDVDVLPNLLIISDMQFDKACDCNEDVMYNVLKRKVEFASRRHNKAWKMPTIIFWNVNGYTQGFPVKSEQTDTVLLSGFSPSLLEKVLSSNYKTPKQAVESLLNDKAFDNIRYTLSELMVGKLSSYTYGPVLEVNDEEFLSCKK